jgi:hypothetical protein
VSFPEPHPDDLVADPLDRAALELGFSAAEQIPPEETAGRGAALGAAGIAAFASLKELPERTAAQARKLVSLAFEQAWRHPLPVRTSEDLAAALGDAAHNDELLERLKGMSGMAAAATVARAAKWIKRFPAARVLVVATTAIELAGAARRGSRELTAVGSYLLLRARAEGIDVDRDRWERATLELVLKPGRMPTLEASVPALVGKMGGSWAYRAIRPSSDRAVRKRAATVARTAATVPSAMLAPAPRPR